MSKKSNLCDEEPFSSFLAGIFLIRREISNKEFYEIMNEFTNSYSTDIFDDDSFCLPLLFTNDGFRLRDDYDDFIFYNNKKITIKKYLNSIVSSRVKIFLKEYFKCNASCNESVKKLTRKI